MPLCSKGHREASTCGCACVALQVASALGCRCFIAMPDDAAIEKANILTAMGAGPHIMHTEWLVLALHAYSPIIYTLKGACNWLRAGAEVQRLRPVSITHPDHPVNVARRRAQEEGTGNALFADQFENLANLRST